MPAGTRIYAVGDIHGRFDLLERALDRIDDDLARSAAGQAKIVFVGDYVDRGLESAMVIERLSQLEASHNVICLRGNHETLMGAFLEHPPSYAPWVEAGGLPTLTSYGLSSPPMHADTPQAEELCLRFRQLIPPHHLAFIQRLRSHLVVGDYVFVHAGLRPRLPIARQSEDDMLWIREDFLLYNGMHEKRVVHGHSPVVAPEVLPNRINIDTGAYATGNLTCLVLERDESRFI